MDRAGRAPPRCCPDLQRQPTMNRDAGFPAAKTQAAHRSPVASQPHGIRRGAYGSRGHRYRLTNGACCQRICPDLGIAILALRIQAHVMKATMSSFRSGMELLCAAPRGHGPRLPCSSRTGRLFSRSSKVPALPKNRDGSGQSDCAAIEFEIRSRFCQLTEMWVVSLCARAVGQLDAHRGAPQSSYIAQASR